MCLINFVKCIKNKEKTLLKLLLVGIISINISMHCKKYSVLHLFVSSFSPVKCSTSWTRWFPQRGSTSALSATSSNTISPRWSAWICRRTCEGNAASFSGMWRSSGTSTASTSWRIWRHAPTPRCPSVAVFSDTWVQAVGQWAQRWLSDSFKNNSDCNDVLTCSCSCFSKHLHVSHQVSRCHSQC